MEVTPECHWEAGSPSPGPGVYIKCTCVGPPAACGAETGARGHMGMWLWEKIFIKWLFQMFNLQQMHLTIICLAWLSLWGDAVSSCRPPGAQEMGLRCICDSTPKEGSGGGDNQGWLGRAAGAGGAGPGGEGKGASHLPVAPVGHPQFNFQLTDAVCLIPTTGIINGRPPFLLKIMLSL